jgi:hypothetical protein
VGAQAPQGKSRPSDVFDEATRPIVAGLTVIDTQQGEMVSRPCARHVQQISFFSDQLPHWISNTTCITVE